VRPASSIRSARGTRRVCRTLAESATGVALDFAALTRRLIRSEPRRSRTSVTDFKTPPRRVSVTPIVAVVPTRGAPAELSPTPEPISETGDCDTIAPDIDSLYRTYTAEQTHEEPTFVPRRRVYWGALLPGTRARRIATLVAGAVLFTSAAAMMATRLSGAASTASAAAANVWPCSRSMPDPADSSSARRSPQPSPPI
jgi:hypothetical protein